jgi:predicted nuclease of predicted toxin-antitoxin system
VIAEPDDPRLRRLRATETLRGMVRETHLRPDDFIYPLFVTHGKGVKKEIGSMPGNYQQSIDNLVKDCEEVKGLGIPAEKLASRPDSQIWAAAQHTRRFLITQDLDFSDLRRFEPGSHHGVLLLRLRIPSRRNLNERLEEILTHEDIESWKGCFVVATDSKIRVRRQGVN